jgi:hypothetical protein
MLTLVHTLTWPRFIGITVGLLGFGSLLSSIGADLPLSLFTPSFHLLPVESFFAVGLSALFLALSYPLYRAHDWARRVLFCFSLVILAGLIIIFGSAVARRPRLALDGPPSAFTPDAIARIRGEELVLRLSRGGELFCAVTLQSFLTLGLLHPDVVRAFHRRGTPNHHERI